MNTKRGVTTLSADYVIQDVTPNDGSSLRDIHAEVLGRPCFIVDAEKGCRGLIRYLPEYDARFHRLHTSVIREIITKNGEDDVTIVTNNTTYHLVRTNMEASFRGIQVYTMDDAREQTINDLRNHGESVGSMDKDMLEDRVNYTYQMMKAYGYCPYPVR